MNKKEKTFYNLSEKYIDSGLYKKLINLKHMIMVLLLTEGFKDLLAGNVNGGNEKEQFIDMYSGDNE